MSSPKAFALLLLLTCTGAVAQVNDFGAWTSLSFRQKLPAGLRGDLELESRFNENGTSLGNLFADLSVSHKLNDYMRLAVNGRFGNKRDNTFEFQTRMRYAVDLSASTEWKGYNFSIRSRFQSSGSSLASETRNAEFTNSWRNKVGISAKLMKKTTGSLSCELFNSLSNSNAMMLTDWRAAFKVDRKISKRQTLTLGYLMQGEVNRANPLRDYVIVAGYSWELKNFKKCSPPVPDEPQKAPVPLKSQPPTM